jgi:septum formation protein
VAGAGSGDKRSVERLLLASTSPRRTAILEQLGVPFDAVAPSYVEEDIAGCRPGELVATHATGKAESLQNVYPDRLILGVDTGVALGDQLYGKPRDDEDALRILSALAGETHTVVSGVCLLDRECTEVEVAATAVTFKELSQAQIERYVAQDEWQGLAGGYAIQGRGALLVERVEGDYLNIVGLPSALLLRMLERRRPALVSIGT